MLSNAVVKFSLLWLSNLALVFASVINTNRELLSNLALMFSNAALYSAAAIAEVVERPLRVR